MQGLGPGDAAGLVTSRREQKQASLQIDFRPPQAEDFTSPRTGQHQEAKEGGLSQGDAPRLVQRVDGSPNGRAFLVGRACQMC